MCAEIGGSPGAVARHLSPFAIHTSDTVERDARAFAWMHEDLVASARKDVSLHGFGMHLTEMYEEIGLLYRLGRSMNQLARPEDFVENACADLQQSTSFRWVATRFAASDRTAAGVAGDLVLSGSLPCDIDEFDRLAGLLLDTLPPDRWSLLTPRDGVRDLAGLVNSEVLVHPIARDGGVIGALFAGNKFGPDPAVSSFETQLLDAAADYLRVFIENSDLYSDQHILFVGTVEALAASIDAKDSYTCGHSQRVAHLGKELALATGMGDEAAERVRIAGLLHDVGKIGVPEAILCKPGRLTEEEFAQIKKHPQIGQRILKDIPFLEDILPGVLYHHERPDGRGYPEGLAGLEVPLIARLLGIADAFDAMSSSRSYRAAMPRDRALDEVRRGAGTQFDAELVPHFLAIDFTEYDRMVASRQWIAAAAA
jgi:HD-GYP domain-containing protein (c-di-GMP phosphodiesterase class II)